MLELGILIDPKAIDVTNLQPSANASSGSREGQVEVLSV